MTFEVEGGADKEMTRIVLRNKSSVVHQRFRIIYTDSKGYKGYKTTGTYQDFGMKIGEEFILQSKLPMGRVAECVGASNVVLKRFVKNRRSQLWRFDGKTKQILNGKWRNYAMTISGSNLRVTVGTSRWINYFRW